MPEIDALLQGGLKSFASAAGLRFRTETDGRVSMRRLPDPPGGLVYAEPLQTASGQFHKDAASRLLVGGLTDSINAKDVFEREQERRGIDANTLGQLQMELLSSDDPMPILERVASSDPYLRMYRIGSRDKLMRRLFLWRIIQELSSGTAPGELRAKMREDQSSLVAGLVELAPAGLVCAAMLAMHQPLAMVLLTSFGSQVAIVRTEHFFIRSLLMVDWPRGMTGMALAGRGAGVYRSKIKAFPAGFSEALLQLLVNGADRMIDKLTSPSLFVLPSGDLDTQERWMAWASVRMGLDALTTLALRWDSPENLWTAFRCLGILQGFWEGAREGSVHLETLLDPRKVRQYAVSRFSIPEHRQWAGDIVGNYQSEVMQFAPGDLGSAVRKVAELRNLVHGVGSQKKERTRRLDILRVADLHAPNLQLVLDVAAFWWMSVLLDPDRNCRPGSPPWAA